MPKKSEPVITDPAKTDFANLVNLMAVFAEATTRMGELENSAQSGFIDLVDESKETYSELQQAIMEAESSLEIIARKHPEWFADSKTVKTPFGSVSFRSTTKLKVTNEELTIVLIEQRIAKEDLGSEEPPSAKLLRHTTALNLEALEQLSDDELSSLRVSRVTSDSFTAKPLKVDLGKAVKSAAEKTKTEGVLA